MKKTCFGLIRSSHNDSQFGYSDILFSEVVTPIFDKMGYDCIRIDPRDFGANDAPLFRLIESADVMVVDGSAKSADYQYSLGVRHALTQKPTIIFVPDNEVVPFDVYIPKGVISFNKEALKNYVGITKLRSELKNILNIFAARSKEGYSPVRTALEEMPRVFLSYAHVDAESVRTVDQWLRDKGARVDIDERNFIASKDIRDEIVRWIREAGKVVCFYSLASQDRYYTKLERRIAEEVEMGLQKSDKNKSVLLYFRLDDTPLPTESSYRLAINAWQMGFEEACYELWRHIIEECGAETYLIR